MRSWSAAVGVARSPWPAPLGPLISELQEGSPAFAGLPIQRSAPRRYETGTVIVSETVPFSNSVSVASVK